jgi:hypothetical protein
MRDKQPVPCPIEGCKYTAGKTAIRNHLHNDHGKTYYQAEQLLPFETLNRATKATLLERIKNLEKMIPLSPTPPAGHTSQPADEAVLNDISKKLEQSESTIQDQKGEMAILHDQVAHLQSEEHSVGIISSWVQGLGPEEIEELVKQKGRQLVPLNAVVVVTKKR